MRNFEPFWNRACASCRRTVQRAACVPASALSTATRFVEYRLTDGHSVGAAPGNHWGSISSCSYIKPQLVRFGTTFSERCLSSCSYIKPQLASRGRRPRGGCLSSCSYIKPQLRTGSPRNRISCLSSCSYIKPQLLSPGVFTTFRCLSSCSYIKPQPEPSEYTCLLRCLSSCSYIKPQPIAVNLLAISKILRFELLRNGRAGRFLLQIY